MENVQKMGDELANGRPATRRGVNQVEVKGPAGLNVCHGKWARSKVDLAACIEGRTPSFGETEGVNADDDCLGYAD